MSRISKKVTKAFEYFPFGQNSLGIYEAWVHGPAFMAKVVGLDDELSVMSGLGIYKEEDKHPNIIAILAIEPEEDLIIDSTKHSAHCSGRRFVSTNMELAYCYYDLAKALGVKKYKASKMIVYGYTDSEELVFVCAARFMNDKCLK